MGAHLSISLWHRRGLGGSGTHGGGRTRRVSSVEPESVSSVRKRKVWSVGREKGLFLSEQDLFLRWNQKAFPLCTEKTWYGKEDSKSKAGIRWRMAAAQRFIKN